MSDSPWIIFQEGIFWGELVDCSSGNVIIFFNGCKVQWKQLVELTRSLIL